ncbi:hypothetical protein C8R45DRAFT_1068850 [Mycena sanguinolenta]|nr:hypothetical protein C8R45DRAFT_1068850 [Mycena sanguinolenta]
MSPTDSSSASASQPSRKGRWNPFKSKASSSTISNHISGGQGGSGGSGGVQGQGGSGGTGQGPVLQYHIKTKNLTMNTVHASSPMVQASQAINHCPPPSKIFHGLQAILETMHQFFAQDKQEQKIYVLYGLGGAGKTQIALKFIQESNCFTDQLLVDASTMDTIEVGLRNIAVTKGTGNTSQDALMWLASKHEEWLLFLDNADDPTTNLNHFFPKCIYGNISLLPATMVPESMALILRCQIWRNQTL